MKSLKWMIAGSSMLTSVLLLSINYSTGKRKAIPVQTTVQTPGAGKNIKAINLSADNTDAPIQLFF